MGLPSGKYDHARDRHGTYCRHDRGKAPSRLCRRRRIASRLIALALVCLGSTATADQIRIATYNTELSRKGPGLLLRDIRSGKDDQVQAVVAVITRTAPDILVLQGIDYDLTGLALTALADALADAGQPYPYRFSRRPNAGMPTGLDMNGDGRLGSAADAQGYGLFSGQGGMAVLSRFPIATAEVKDFTALKWRDLPGALLPTWNGKPFPSQQAQAAQRLSSNAHWVVPVTLPNGETLDLLTFHATPPVFDGPEDRNGRRNHDEIRFWQLYLDGLIVPPRGGPFVLLGDANLDPFDSDGRAEAIRNLLADPRLQDPRPQRTSVPQPSSDGHKGPPELDTVDWKDPIPGNLRVSYVLPSTKLRVVGSGVYWPSDTSTIDTASRHRLVWVDLAFD